MWQPALMVHTSSYSLSRTSECPGLGPEIIITAWLQHSRNGDAEQGRDLFKEESFQWKKFHQSEMSKLSSRAPTPFLQNTHSIPEFFVTPTSQLDEAFSCSPNIFFPGSIGLCVLGEINYSENLMLSKDLNKVSFPRKPASVLMGFVGGHVL